MKSKCFWCGKRISKGSIRCKSCSNMNRAGTYHLSERTKKKISFASKNRKRYPHSKETKRKIGLANLGEKNGKWKGNKVGYNGVHRWVRINKLKPRLCEKCRKKEAYDLANISGKYKRDVNDYEWLCRGCHMKSDRRIKNLKQFK